MTRRQIWVRGMCAGFLLALIAQAAHWFLSAPSDASELRRIGVVLQAVVCGLGVLWLASGVPGEPDVTMPDAHGVANPPGLPNALNEGGWSEESQAPGSATSSPVPQNHRA
jgi:hypothetical protein